MRWRCATSAASRATSGTWPSRPQRPVLPGCVQSAAPRRQCPSRYRELAGTSSVGQARPGALFYQIGGVRLLTAGIGMFYVDENRYRGWGLNLLLRGSLRLASSVNLR